MSGMENFLPESYQFNTALTEVREPLVDELYEFVEDLGDVIDPQAEFSRPYARLWELSGALAELYKSETEESEAVRVAMYRGMSFGLQVVDGIKNAPLQTISMKYLEGSPEDVDYATILHTDVQEYLSQRPAIDRLIFSFMPEIDKTYLYNHHVELAAGLIFMMCEKEQAENYLQAQVEGLSPDSL